MNKIKEKFNIFFCLFKNKFYKKIFFQKSKECHWEKEIETYSIKIKIFIILFKN